MTEWTEALSIGHQGIDAQHRDLIACVNALNEAVAAASDDPSGTERVAAIAAAFYSSYRAHATYEELIMHQFFYAKIERHAEHHAMHTDALATLLVVDPMVEAIRVNLPFINSAVFDHIERDDRDFGCYLKELGLFGKV